MSYHNSKQTKTTEGWVRQGVEHANNINFSSEGLVPYSTIAPTESWVKQETGHTYIIRGPGVNSTMPHPNLTFEVNSIEVQLLGERFDY